MVGQKQWLMSVILGIWEVGIRKMEVQSQPRQKVSETPSQKVRDAGLPVIPVMREA
jgi:hypothetical protein